MYLVGLVNRERIPRFKRTAQFIPEDYNLLEQIVAGFQKVIITPNILTEVNSLANQLGELERSQCLIVFARLISQITEEYIESKLIINVTDALALKLPMSTTPDLNLYKHSDIKT